MAAVRRATSTATAHGIRLGRTILAAQIDHVQHVDAYPTPWPVGVAAAVGDVVPGAVPGPLATWRTTSVSRTRRARRTEDRGSSKPSHANCSSTSWRVEWSWIRRPAAPEHPRAATNLPYANANSDEVQRRVPSRGVQQALDSSTTTVSAEQTEVLPPAATRDRETPATSSRPRLPWVITAGSATDRIEPSGRSTCTWRAGRPGTASRNCCPNSRPTPSVSTSATT